ncbi:MAG TPA: glutaminyl-peptide cyclotransferase [Pyrinomonadaceae bacterium]
MKRQLYGNALLVCILLIAGCSGTSGTTTTTLDNARRSASTHEATARTNAAQQGSAGGGGGTQPATAEPEETPTYSYKIKNSWPHDRRAYTQGLIFLDGILWESTGQYGASSLRKVELKTGKVIKQISVPRAYFAEGMTVFHNKVFQLTWQEQKGFIYDPATFQKQGEFSYTGEGWGLTHDGQSLIMSDGTDRIRFLDPSTLQTTRTIGVTDRGAPVDQLNELEYIDGEIYANIYQTDRIARIEPKTGRVLAWIDLTGLLEMKDRNGGEDVLNGIAYDERDKRLFVTGKLWPKLFEIEIVRTKTHS